MAASDSDGEMFYTSGGGDRWLLVTDTGGRRFVRHVPNRSSGGTVELTDLQSFRDREPHSAQNQALETMLEVVDGVRADRWLDDGGNIGVPRG